MKRRRFVTTVAGAAGLVSLAGRIRPATAMVDTIVKPPKLSKGDRVGLVTPGSGIAREDFEKCLQNLHMLDLEPVYSDNIRVRKGFLAGTDSQRLNDIHRMFKSDSVAGIICARGGYGSGRLLPALDFEVIKNNPKPFVGYSDITALLIAIFQRTGLVCFHGPVASSEFSEFTQACFEAVLFENKKAVLKLEDDGYTIAEGESTGVLAGGNLSLIASLMGTQYELDLRGKLLFIEEVGESPYRIDRMLTQLLLSGGLHEVKGVVLGTFEDCETERKNPDFPNSLSLKEVLTDRLSRLNIPVVYGFKIGHIVDNATIPYGIEATLNTENATLSFEDKALTQ